MTCKEAAELQKYARRSKCSVSIREPIGLILADNQDRPLLDGHRATIVVKTPSPPMAICLLAQLPRLHHQRSRLPLVSLRKIVSHPQRKRL
jgi:hypothetical protein